MGNRSGESGETRINIYSTVDIRRKITGIIRLPILLEWGFHLGFLLDSFFRVSGLFVYYTS